MADHNLFASEENRTLVAISARKLIGGIGIGGIIWGIINLIIGLFALQVALINAGILVLALLMFVTGVIALVRPSLTVLLLESIVAWLLFGWNLAITLISLMVGASFVPMGLVLPLIFAIVFLRYYLRLQKIEAEIAMTDREKIREATRMCKTILKAKVKDDESLVESQDRRCRIRCLNQSALFVRRGLTQIIMVSKPDAYLAIAKPDAKKLLMRFKHPLGDIACRFDKKNSEKIRAWLDSNDPPPSLPLGAPSPPRELAPVT